MKDVSASTFPGKPKPGLTPANTSGLTAADELAALNVTPHRLMAHDLDGYDANGRSTTRLLNGLIPSRRRRRNWSACWLGGRQDRLARTPWVRYCIGMDPTNDDAAVNSVMAFAGLDGPLPTNAPEWDALADRVERLRQAIDRLNLHLALSRPSHVPPRSRG